MSTRISMIYRLLSLCVVMAPVGIVSAQGTNPGDAGMSVFLQVGAFGNEGHARAMEERLRGAGLENVWVLGADVNGRHVFRVRIGPLGDSLDQQATVVDQVRALGISDPFLIRSPRSVEENISRDAAASVAERSVDVASDQTADSTPIQVRVASSEGFRLPPLDVAPAAGTRQLSQVPKLFVQRIEVRGVSAFSDAEIASITRPYVNREVSNAELQELRVALSRNYVEHQFVNSGVVLPDQRVNDGVVLYEAIEGSLTRVEIEGNHHLSQRYVEGRLRRHLGDPLKFTDIQYALQYLQKDPNVDRLDAQFAPGDGLGESVLRLVLEEPPRFRAGLGIDNYGSSNTGAEQATAYLSARNLTGFGEALSLSGGVSDGTDNYSAVFAMPITRRNTQIQIYGYRSDSSIVEARFQVLDIDSLTDTWGARLTQPIVDNLDTTLSMVVGYEEKQSESKLLGLPFSFSPGAQNGESNTNVAQLAVDWKTRGPSHVFALRGNYRKGLDSGDATIFQPMTPLDRLRNPTGADGRFELYQTQILYLYRLSALPLFANLHERSQLLFRTTSQITKDPLMSLEKLAIGGVSTVRGYPENLLVRDNGIAATLELQLPIPGYIATPHPRNLLIVPFLDYGRSWDRIDTDPDPLRNTDDAKYIIGLGLGLIWEPFTGLQAQLFWGLDGGDNFDVSDDPRAFRDPDLQDDGVHISVNYSVAW